MEIISNLKEELHPRVVNYVRGCNSIPCIVNYFHEYEDGSTDELEVYELIEFNYKDGVYYLVYEAKELTRMAPEKVKEYKQLKLL